MNVFVFFPVVAHTQLQQLKTFITIQVTVSLFVVCIFLYICTCRQSITFREGYMEVISKLEIWGEKNSLNESQWYVD